jgi:hypothetical protein
LASFFFFLRFFFQFHCSMFGQLTRLFFLDHFFIYYFGFILPNWVPFKIKLCNFSCFDFYIRLARFGELTWVCRYFIFLSFFMLTFFYFSLLHLDCWGLVILIFFNLLFIRLAQPQDSSWEFGMLAQVNSRLFFLSFFL